MRRCPACRATNPDQAAWCNQCYARLEEPPAAVPPPTAAPPPATAPPPAAPGGRPVDGPAGDRDASLGLRRTATGLEWVCPACETPNALERERCEACATPFGAQLAAPAAVAPPRDWRRARLLSALAPGAGHLAVGAYGSGIARLALFCMWLASGVLLAGAGPALFIAGPLLLAAGVLWAGSLLDMGRLQRGERELLDGRGLLWLVVGALGATMLGAVLGAAVMQGTRGGGV